MGKKIVLTKNQELEIIKYYLTPFTLTETAIHFNLQRRKVKELLENNNIQLHSKEVNNKAKIQKTKNTNLKRYGVSNSYQIPKIREKAQKVWKDTEKEVFKKMKETSIERYGVPFFNNQEKMKQTRLEKYGVTNFFQDKEIHNKALINAKSSAAKEKKKQTCLNNFGVEYSLSSKEIREKIETTNRNKYGGSSPSCSKSVQEKMKQTSLKKYGKEHYTQTDEYKQRHQVTWNNKTEKERQEIVDKVVETKKLRHTFNTSSPEELFYTKLIDKFGVENIKRQYKDDRYPFSCDFYIVPLDMFIELNLFFSHG